MMIYTADERLHQQAAAQAQRDRFMGRACAGHKPDERRRFAREVEVLVAQRLREAGHSVARTSHTAHYDLLCDGVRLEVKAASWSNGRYQCALRANVADALVWCCRNGCDHWFVVPFGEVAGLTHLKISSLDPADYRGRLRAYLEAWDVLDDMIKAGVNHWQLPLM